MLQEEGIYQLDHEILHSKKQYLPLREFQMYWSCFLWCVEWYACSVEVSESHSRTCGAVCNERGTPHTCRCTRHRSQSASPGPLLDAAVTTGPASTSTRRQSCSSSKHQHWPVRQETDCRDSPSAHRREVEQSNLNLISTGGTLQLCMKWPWGQIW